MRTKEGRKSRHAGWRLSRKEKFSYYIGDMGRAAAVNIMTTFMTTFLLFQGIDVLAVAGVTAVIKVIDAMDDMIFGYFVDRLKITEWKWAKKFAGEGKYLPWYRLTFWSFPVATILFFLMPRDLPDAGKLAWYAVTYLLYDLTCTLSEVPMSSMIMTLTDNVDERNSVIKEKTIFSTVFALALGVGWPFLISEHIGLPVTSVAIVSAVVSFGFMIPLARNVHEYNATLKNTVSDTEKQYTVLEMLKCVKTNKYMIIYLVFTLIKTVAGAAGSVSLFVSFYLFHDSMILNYAVPLALIPGFLLQIFSDKIQKKLGRRNSLLYMNILYVAGNLIVYMVGYESKGFIIFMTALMGTFNFLYGVVMSFLVPDTIEYTRYKTGEDCSGIFYALLSFVNKATTGLSGSLGVALLGVFGFQAVNATSFADLEGVAQPQSAIDGMWFLYALFPAICYGVSALVLLLYNLKDSDAQLMAKCNSGQISREECEGLLSRKY